MQNILYYHLYLTDDYGTWSSMFLEHMKMMEDNKILDILDGIEFTVVTNNNQRKMNSFVNLQGTYDIGRKKSIEFVLSPYETDEDMLNSIETSKTITENHTMRKIWNDSQEKDMIILYLHSKGITSTKKHLESGDAETFKKYHYWRQFLNWGVIENWEKCYGRIKFGDYDIAGVNYLETPSKHFSGNYWWSKSKYIKTLPDPSKLDWWYELKRKTNDHWLKNASDRFRDEQWPCCSEIAKIYNVFSSKNKYGYGPADKTLNRIFYEEE